MFQVMLNTHNLKVSTNPHMLTTSPLMKSVNTTLALAKSHTQDIGDAFIPNTLNTSKDKYIIVHPNNVSIKGIGDVANSLGGIPLPDDREAYANFLKAIDRRIKEKKAVVIYPEAHIWPYYTGIRPFPDASFHYPIKLGVPVFCFTNTYQKSRCSREPKIVTYVEGPFDPNKDLPLKEQRTDLRDRVYAAMKKNAERSTVETIKYIKATPRNNDN